jgi:hypothetical protein
LFVSDQLQPDSIIEWNGCALDGLYSFVGYYSHISFDGLFGNALGTDGGEIESEGGKRRLNTSGTGTGGGFDGNWLIKRNIKPIDVKIYSPSEFSTSPKSAGESCCKPDSSYISTRAWNKNVASATTNAYGDVDIAANRHITAKAGQNITAKAGLAISAQAGTSITARALTSISAQAGTTITARAGASITAQAGASITIRAGGIITERAAAIFLN